MVKAADEATSSSSSSSEVSVKFENDAAIPIYDSVVAPVSISNGTGNNSSGSEGASISRVKTMPPAILNSANCERPEEKCEPSVLERSKTQRQRNNLLPEDAEQIFDNRISVQKKDYGHRVRLATHSNFKEFVLTSGLEFYSFGGDPKVLVEYMVKNKGFLPSGPSEIPIQRNQIKKIIYSLLPACKEPDIDSGIPFKADVSSDQDLFIPFSFTFRLSLFSL